MHTFPVNYGNLVLKPISCKLKFFLFTGVNSDFVYSKESYKRVSKSSPIFAVDCEMVRLC